MKRIVLIISAVIVLAGCTSNKKNETFENTRPNIIFILADDLGYGDLGCYGQTKIETPNLDKMASEGMLFTQHYSGSTVCAPSRCVLLSGLHTGHCDIRGNKEYNPEGQHPMKDEVFTVPELLKELGYATGAFGKWGLGFVGTEGDPTHQGFDEFYGYNCQREAHRYYPKHLWHNNEKVLLEGNDFKNTETFAVEVIHEQALKFIEDNKDKPFFMYYPNVIPHAEIIMPEGEMMQKYRGRFEEIPYVNDLPGSDYGDEQFEVKYYNSQPEPRTTFAAMVSLLDKQVGDVQEKLKELGIEDNTVIMFSSDNGPHMEGGADPEFFNSNGGLRGFKRELYEGGVRAPLIVKWPNKVQFGSKSEHISAFWDIMPTLAEVAGAAVPENTDGISFLPELTGKVQRKHSHLYWEFHGQHGKQAVRKSNWKLVKLNILDAPRTKVELYNLDNDPSEKNDVSELYPEIEVEMNAILKKEHSFNAGFPFEGSRSNY
jgi:arylsulfatase A-like enzyme